MDKHNSQKAAHDFFHNLSHKELEEGARIARKEDEVRMQNRELLKRQSVSSSGKYPLIYLMDKIIEKCLVHTTGSIEMSINYLDVPEDHSHIVHTHKFFLLLKDYGCFETIERVGHVFVVSKPDLKKLNQYKVELLARLNGESEKEGQKVPEDFKHAPSNLSASFTPRLIIENKVGYLQLFKQQTKLRIGKIGTRKFKLVQCLFNADDSIDAPYNPVFQKYERVYRAIRLEKDAKNNRLTDAAVKKNEMKNIVEFTIKELQKDGARRYMKFERKSDLIRIEITAGEGKKSAR